MVYVPVPLGSLGLSTRLQPLDAKSVPVYDAKTGLVKPPDFSIVHGLVKHNAPNPGITSDVPDRTYQPQIDILWRTAPRIPEGNPVRKTELHPNGGSTSPGKASVLSSGSDFNHESQSQKSSPPTSSASMPSRQAEPEPSVASGCGGSRKKKKERPTNKAKASSFVSTNKANPSTSLLDHDPVPDILSDSISTRLGLTQLPPCDFIEPPPAAEANPFVNHEAVRHLRDLLEGRRSPSDLYVPKVLADRRPKATRDPVIDSAPNVVTSGLPKGYREGLPISIPDQCNPPPWENAFSPDTVNPPNPPAPTNVSSSSNQDEFFDAPAVKPPSSSPTGTAGLDDSGRKKACLPQGAFAHILSPAPDPKAEKCTVPLCPNFLKLPKSNLRVKGTVSLGSCSLCARPLDELRYSRWEQDDGPEHQGYGQMNPKQTQTTLAEVRGRGPIFWSRRHRYGYDDPVISSCAKCLGTWHRKCTERYTKSQEKDGKKPRCPECGDLWFGFVESLPTMIL